MRNRLKAVFATFAVLGLVGLGAQRATAQSSRAEAKFGFHLGLLGDPFPTIVGGNLDFNALDFFRLTAGYGSISVSSTSGSSTNELSATTFGGGARLFIPGANFSPVLGVGWAKVKVTATGNNAGQDVGGFTGDGEHFYATFGFDYQAGGGFNIGAGWNESLKSGIGGLPYINLGYFFKF